MFYFVIGDMYILKSVYAIDENGIKLPFVFTFDVHENGIKVLINFHVAFLKKTCHTVEEIGKLKNLTG